MCMKKHLLTFLSCLLLIFVTTGAFSQNGELNGFDDASLEEKQNTVRLFPNPTTTDYLRVRIENSTLSNPVFTVHSIIGNVVEVEVEPIGKNEFRIKVKDLVSGYYLLAIRDEQGHFKEAYKFLKR